MEQINLNNEKMVDFNKSKNINRTRPNKANLLKQAELRGFNTSNEQLMLTGLTLDNMLQRINNKAMKDIIKNHDCIKIEKLMIKLITTANKIIGSKKKVN
jgi:hypothetical protein